jgi:hypothetical protein
MILKSVNVYKKYCRQDLKFQKSFCGTRNTFLKTG